VRDHLQLQDVTLTGNSLGGGTSLAVIRDEGPRIKRLILVDALGGGAVPGLFGFFIEEYATGPMFAAFDDGILEMFTNWFVFEQQNAHTDQLMSTFLSSRGATQDGYAWSWAVSSYLRNAGDYDATPWLAEIKAPTLIVWGDSDWILWESSAEHLRDNIPGARLVILEDCGHMPQIERPEALAEVIKGFLGEGAGEL
jgi:pimeloyl-ACP methyl ester carboxylesterase